MAADADTAEVEVDEDGGLENIEASFTDEESDESTEDKTEETETEEETTDDESEDTQEPDKEAEVVEEVPELDTKARNREMAEKRIQAKAEREEALKKQQQEYIAEADAEDPRDLAVRQLQVDAYNNKVTANENRLNGEYQRAIKDFDILSDPNPVIQAKVARAIDLFQAGSVSIDQYGNPTEIRGDFYTYLQTEADSIRELTGIGAAKQSKSKDKERSKVLDVPSRAPKEPKKDAMLDGFDEEADRW
jgi:hypothetical protein